MQLYPLIIVIIRERIPLSYSPNSTQSFLLDATLSKVERIRTYNFLLLFIISVIGLTFVGIFVIRDLGEIQQPSTFLDNLQASLTP